MPDEYLPPTHVLTVEVPMRLHGDNPIVEATVMRDCLNIVLATARVSTHVVFPAEASLREVDPEEAERR